MSRLDRLALTGLLILGVVVAVLPAVRGGRGIPARHAPTHPAPTREHRKVPFRDPGWSPFLTRAALASGVNLSELNSRPTRGVSAGFQAPLPALVRTLAFLEQQGVPLERVWLGQTPTGDGYRLLVDLKPGAAAPDSSGRSKSGIP